MRKRFQRLSASKPKVGTTSSQKERSCSSSLSNTKRGVPYNHFEAVMQGLPQSVVCCDQHGKVLWMNAAALALFEISTLSSSQGIFYQQLLEHSRCQSVEQSANLSEQWLLDLFADDTLSAAPTTILRLKLPSERSIYLGHWHLPLTDREASIHVLQDMTVQYQRIEHLHRVQQAVMRLTEAIADLSQQADHLWLEESTLLSLAQLFVAHPLVEVIGHVLDCHRVFLMAYRPTGQFHYVAAHGLTPEQEQFHLERGWRAWSAEYVDEEVLIQLAARQEVIIPVQCLSKALPFLVGMDAESILLIPLFLDHQRVGSLSVIKKGSEQGYSAQEIELVRTVAEQAMMVIACIRCLQNRTYNGIQARILQEVHHLGNDFLTLASHELRTPLAGIKGNLQLAQRRLEKMKRQIAEETAQDEEPLTQILQPLASASESLWLQERMLQNLIDDACLQANELELSLRSCDLLPLVQAAVMRHQRLVSGNTIVLQMKPQVQKCPVLADAERIRRVLDTYLENALRSAPCEQPVTVELTIEDFQVRVAVHDEGLGIPLQDQKHLWERFYRAKGLAVQHELDLSCGLGLYLCQAFIQRHRGSVGVQSAPGHGTTFWFTLPIASHEE